MWQQWSGLIAVARLVAKNGHTSPRPHSLAAVMVVGEAGVRAGCPVCLAAALVVVRW